MCVLVSTDSVEVPLGDFRENGHVKSDPIKAENLLSSRMTVNCSSEPSTTSSAS